MVIVHQSGSFVPDVAYMYSPSLDTGKPMTLACRSHKVEFHLKKTDYVLLKHITVIYVMQVFQSIHELQVCFHMKRKLGNMV